MESIVKLLRMLCSIKTLVLVGCCAIAPINAMDVNKVLSDALTSAYDEQKKTINLQTISDTVNKLKAENLNPTQRQPVEIVESAINLFSPLADSFLGMGKGTFALAKLLPFSTAINPSSIKLTDTLINTFIKPGLAILINKNFDQAVPAPTPFDTTKSGGFFGLGGTSNYDLTTMYLKIAQQFDAALTTQQVTALQQEFTSEFKQKLNDTTRNLYTTWAGLGTPTGLDMLLPKKLADLQAGTLTPEIILADAITAARIEANGITTINYPLLEQRIAGFKAALADDSSGLTKEDQTKLTNQLATIATALEIVKPNDEGLIYLSAYKAAAQQYNPENNKGDAQVLADRATKDLTTAYQVLSTSNLTQTIAQPSPLSREYQPLTDAYLKFGQELNQAQGNLEKLEELQKNFTAWNSTLNSQQWSAFQDWVGGSTKYLNTFINADLRKMQNQNNQAGTDQFVQQFYKELTELFTKNQTKTESGGVSAIAVAPILTGLQELTKKIKAANINQPEDASLTNKIGTLTQALSRATSLAGIAGDKPLPMLAFNVLKGKYNPTKYPNAQALATVVINDINRIIELLTTPDAVKTVTLITPSPLDKNYSGLTDTYLTIAQALSSAVTLQDLQALQQKFTTEFATKISPAQFKQFTDWTGGKAQYLSTLIQNKITALAPTGGGSQPTGTTEPLTSTLAQLTVQLNSLNSLVS